MKSENHSPEATPQTKAQTGAGAAAAPSTSALRPLVVRTVIGALAILGLSGIGAASMLTGLEGAHASPPVVSSQWLAASSTLPATPPSGSVAISAVPTTSAAASTVTETPLAPTVCPTLTEDGKVILNRARIEDLRKIPGIGPKRADAILALRAKLKQFKRPAELLRVKGIGPKSLVKMQTYFVLNDPKGNDCENAAKPATTALTATPPK